MKDGGTRGQRLLLLGAAGYKKITWWGRTSRGGDEAAGLASVRVATTHGRVEKVRQRSVPPLPPKADL